MFKAIGVILLLVAMKIMFDDVFDAAEIFMLEFFNYGTAVMQASMPAPTP